ncbi:MAG: hypothetical protein HC880_03305 [Bacteroidia bacterium]|nr:hypothetical protein [Bacteroidia bacterium]
MESILDILRLKEKHLIVEIFSEIVGIGVLLEEHKDLMLDLSGFDYSFTKEDLDKVKVFLDYFFKTGEPPASARVPGPKY